ncbi:MAG TPA: hypothetical protein PKV92_07400 [Thermodesulfovibrio thiophilus]|nr:hypothetical protein [Thermodesulfovibrio thiophilus]HQD36901.1 hypothetical protein [Thermodesulfovibrio thiophilus]
MNNYSDLFYGYSSENNYKHLLCFSLEKCHRLNAVCPYAVKYEDGNKCALEKCVNHEKDEK